MAEILELCRTQSGTSEKHAKVYLENKDKEAASQTYEWVAK